MDKDRVKTRIIYSGNHIHIYFQKMRYSRWTPLAFRDDMGWNRFTIYFGSRYLSIHIRFRIPKQKHIA